MKTLAFLLSLYKKRGKTQADERMFLEKFLQLFKKKPPKAIKVGLALGSGGAKGFAHIGALKAFEEHGVKFDVVAGTSIGSIVGAFYANGYSATDMLQLMRTVDFSDVKRLVMIRMNTDGVQRGLEKAIGDLEFSDLKLPFAAVATDFQTGQEVDLFAGKLSVALCASSAYPPFFKPVPVENRLLMDGAFVNSVPADLVRGMGADYVVGVDLSAFRKQNKTGILSEFFPNSKIVTGNASLSGYRNSDVMVKPDLKNFKATQLSSADEMYDLGYEAALAVLPQILGDLDRLRRGKKKGD